MASAFALAMNSGKIIFNFVDLKNLRIFQIYLFTGRVETVNFLLKFNNEVLYGKHEHAGDIGKRPEPLVRRLQGAETYLAGRERAGDHGCGKSTFLKTLNRMNDLVPNVRIEGDVRLKGEDIFAREMQLTDLRRRVGMVFQKANPFPMSIYDNITYGPKLHGVRNKAELDELVEKYDCLAARRGKGFMQGLVVTGRPVGEVINRAIENGLLVISAGSDVLRMVPPLVITKDDIDEMIEKLEKALQ